MAFRDVVKTGVAYYVFLCFVLRHVLCLSANDHTQLSFVVDMPPQAGQDDFVFGADNCSGWFEEDKRHGRHG